MVEGFLKGVVVVVDERVVSFVEEELVEVLG